MSPCKRVLAAAMFAVSAFHVQAAERVPIEAFATADQFHMPRLSPDGQHLAVSVDMGEGSHMIMVLQTADMKRTAVLRLPRFELPVQMYWVSERRLVIAKGREFGPLDEPQAMGEILATDFDGENQKYIYGYEQQSRIPGLGRGFGYIAGFPPQPNGHFYMRQLSQGTRSSKLYDVDAVKTTGRMIADIGVKNLDFIFDNNGVARYATGVDDDDNYLLYAADTQDGDWKKVEHASVGGSFYPVAFMSDNRQVIAGFSAERGPVALVRANADGSNRNELAKDDFGSIGDLEWNPQKLPFAVTVNHGRPRAVYFDANSADAQLHKALNLKFPGYYVTYVNHSSDGNYSLLYAYSDRDPGAWYLFDRKQSKISLLLAARQSIDPAKMGERRYLRFKASDGVELDGWLTLPPGVEEPKNLPMVLLPHGGPHVRGDDWGFDNDAQFLASRGYLVLQVNYRGTRGRGRRFEESGYRVWGTRVQDDLIDGVRWTIAQGYTDPARICSFGASFGAYAAMMTAVRAPGLFKCAAGQSGLYDLKNQATKSDTSETEAGRNYFVRTIGTDPKEWAANSPVNLAAQINVPVFLAHGGADKRTPLSQAQALKTALEAAGNTPEWLVFSSEGHGFYADANNVAFLQRLQAFLERHIGPGVETTH